MFVSEKNNSREYYEECDSGEAVFDKSGIVSDKVSESYEDGVPES